MGEICSVEHAASLFWELDQRSERASCTFYLLTEKVVILTVVEHGIRMMELVEEKKAVQQQDGFLDPNLCSRMQNSLEMLNLAPHCCQFPF
jgi:hypothetical protein